MTPDFSRHLHVINHPIRSNLLGLLVVYGGSRVIQQLRAIVGFHSPDTDNLRDMNPYVTTAFVCGFTMPKQRTNPKKKKRKIWARIALPIEEAHHFTLCLISN